MELSTWINEMVACGRCGSAPIRSYDTHTHPLYIARSSSRQSASFVVLLALRQGSRREKEGGDSVACCCRCCPLSCSTRLVFPGTVHRQSCVKHGGCRAVRYTPLYLNENKSGYLQLLALCLTLISSVTWMCRSCFWYVKFGSTWSVMICRPALVHFAFIFYSPSSDEWNRGYTVLALQSRSRRNQSSLRDETKRTFRRCFDSTNLRPAVSSIVLLRAAACPQVLNESRN